MNKGLTKVLLIVAVVAVAPVMAYLAYSRPGYFSSEAYLGGLLLLEALVAAVWLYRRTFFPLVVVTFLFAGMDLPVGSVWTMARWLVLAVGALVGASIMLKERRYSFGLFHVLAFFCVCAALMSAAVSRYTVVSSLKVLSLFLLFLYAATGARLAVAHRENRFFSGLLLSCEVFVVLIALSYAMGREVMGNPNSLGAVMGVVAGPILLWGTLLQQEPFSHRRRLFLYVVAMYLTYASHARAGILAALVSCAVLCLALRKYSMLAQGLAVIVILAATGAIFQPEAFSRTVSSVTSTVVFKGKDRSLGVLGSRTSPWQDTIDAIRAHFWFGTGFGTSDTGHDPTESLGRFASSSAVTTEHGSSYLEIVAWVGLIGLLPFALLLILLLGKALRMALWMHRTAEPSHPVVPLAILMIAGLVHAGFEDWLFAPGYYLCLFFWSMAFVFVDQAASLSALDARSLFVRRARAMRPHFGAVAASR
ncbi:MAG: O-antigen ligase family protein [Candidatus Sulfotelmatobacter sp.]